jgi:hypothetical protein
LAEITYCIISLSKRDPRFTNETLPGVKNWLNVEKRAQEPYFFHDIKPIRVSKGSKLLFSFQAKLFGIATTKTNVEEVPQEIQEERRRRDNYVYQHFMVLDSESIELFQKEVPKKEIKRVLKINCDRPFRYLTEARYNRILEMGGLPKQK